MAKAKKQSAKRSAKARTKNQSKSKAGPKRSQARAKGKSKSTAVKKSIVAKKSAAAKKKKTAAARKSPATPIKKLVKKTVKKSAPSRGSAKKTAKKALKSRAPKPVTKAPVTVMTPVAVAPAAKPARKPAKKPADKAAATAAAPAPQSFLSSVVETVRAAAAAVLAPVLSSAPQTHLFAEMLARVRGAAGAVLGPDADLSRIVVEPPRDASHGDIATNAAMVLAKEAGKNPRELATAIAEKLRGDSQIEKVDIAGPGFINLTLTADVWPKALRAVLEQGKTYGKGAVVAGHKVNVEYVSANPTGPLHVGHGRGAVFGDALASLLAAAGYDVTREYYINDAGAQVDVLARSAFLRYREALGEDIGEIPEGLYPGDYLKECGQELATDYGDKLKAMPESEWLPIVRRRATDMMMAEIRNDLARLRIVPDVFFSERSLIEGEEPDPFATDLPVARPADVVAQTIDALREQGNVYEGRLPPPKSGNLEDWEDREQTLFRSTDFGDDVDRPLLKSDGSYTYFATDIAYHKSKVDRGFADMIDVWGADHGGYVKRMQAAVKAVSGGKAVLDVKLVQLVRLLRNGEPVKMSKRAGDYITLREVVDEVGKDAVRFDMLYRKNDAVLDFDLAKVIEQSRENPVFYVQYGHARGRSIFRTVAADMPQLQTDAAALRSADLTRLTDAGELSIIRKLALFPRMIEAAAQAHEPHRVAFYLYELASEFHAQWSRGGKESPHLRFIIQDDPQTTLARLALVQGIVTVLASGLDLLGVEAPDEMR
jgi:arginyl-tRNA synthetase